jgi:hypothetical protein
MADSRIRVSLDEGSIEIEGSEAFVAEQLARFEKTILESLAVRQSQRMKQKEENPQAIDGESNTTKDASYDEVFHVDSNGKVSIFTDIPGTNNKAKTVNCALLTVFAKESAGLKSATGQEIAAICTEHGFADPPNFSANLKSDKGLLLDGSGKNATVTLGQPGRKRAKTLAVELATNVKG